MKRIEKGIRTATLLLLLGHELSARAVAETGKSPELARVAILNYEDKTGTKNFEYMPTSLATAIGKSLRQKFEYAGADMKNVEAVATEIRGKKKTIGAEEATEICRRTGVDILILGNFTFDEAAKEISITTYISLGSDDKFKALRPVLNPVDNTIFKTIDTVADDIVAEIARIAAEQKNRQQAAEKNQVEKTRLERIARNKTWRDTTWAIYATGGTLMPFISTKETTVNPGIALGIFATRRFMGPWHVGFSAAFNSLTTESKLADTSATFRTFDFIPSAVYNLDFAGRWRFSSALGAGYYFGALAKEISCAGECSVSGSTSLAVANPVFLARTGIHYLWISYLAVGIDAEWRVHYDSPKSLNTALLTIAVSWVY